MSLLFLYFVDVAKIAGAEPLRHGYSHDVVAVRRALEQSVLYSEELGIDLAQRTDAAYFHWFLASLLFGARISETTAKNTFRAFMRHWLTTPKKIVAAGWDFLVHPVMRDGGYVRYEGRKSTQVLRDCEGLIAHYGGSLGRLHEAARDAPDLEQGLLTFLRHRAGDREHLSARVASLLEQGRSRSSASGEEVGEAPVRRSWTLSTEKPHFRSGGGRSDSAPA